MLFVCYRCFFCYVHVTLFLSLAPRPADSSFTEELTSRWVQRAAMAAQSDSAQRTAAEAAAKEAAAARQAADLAATAKAEVRNMHV